MDKEVNPPTVSPLTSAGSQTPPNANDLLNEFLKKNNLVLNVEAISDDNSYISGKGFVLTDKPLLLVTAKFK